VIPTLTKKEVASLTKPVDGTLVFITDEEENVTTTNQISDISNVSGNGFYYYVATGENKGTWASSGSVEVLDPILFGFHILAGLAWAIFHILVITLQAFIFMALAFVYIGQAHDAH